MVIFLTFILFFLNKVSSLEIEPIVFVGPLGGQGLECKLEKSVEPHFWCFENEDWFKIWMDIEEEVPHLSLDCFLHNMAIFFDTKTNTFHNNKGVSIRPQDFGGMGAFEYLASAPIKEKSSYMHEWMVFLEQYGYEVGKSLRGVSYDWRMGPKEWEINTEWGFPAVKTLVEETYAMNGNKKIHMMGHSLGSPTANYFLTSFVSQEWKDKYIASFISLGGPFDGAFVSTYLNIIGFTFYQLFKQSIEWDQIMQQIAGTQWMLPTEIDMDLPFFFTKDRPQGYSMNEYGELMEASNSTISYEIYNHEKVAIKNKAPGVPTHCLYGIDVPTPKIFYVEDPANTITNTNFTVLETVSGDSTVHLKSLMLCDGFASQQQQPVTVKRYSGMVHSEMVKNESIWYDVLNITTHM